jgi:hypothetical protein
MDRIKPEQITTIPGTEVTEDQQPAAPIPEKKEETVKIPTSIIRWLFYIPFFYILLLPAFLCKSIDIGLFVSLPLILAHFAGQLNKLISK